MVRVGLSRQWVFTTLLLLGAIGCESDESRDRGPEPRAPELEARAKDPFLRGTIGEKTLLGNVDREELRGYGLVVGLGNNGSTDCPTTIRDYLLDFMSKQYRSNDGADYKRGFSPANLIDSPDAAVVEVRALVPAGAAKDTRTDLWVTALQGTSTKSLEGGLLLPTELRLFTGAVDKDSLMAGDVLGEANGPIYINPTPADEMEQNPEIDPRQGLVLGGGRVKVDRTSRLVLLEPAPSEARKIEQRINERFGQKPPTADATSRSYITLHTPPKFHRRPRRFLDLTPRLYLENNPVFLDSRLRDMSKIFKEENGNYEQASLALEALGARSLSQLRPFYADPSPKVRFYAARAGLRLGDASAVDVIGKVAASKEPERLQATIELGESEIASAASQLLPLLDSTDQQVRINAYEGLLNHRHPVIKSIAFPHILDQLQNNLILDVVESSGKPLIFVRQTKVPRIAVFGSRMPVSTPLFFTFDDNTVTINAAKPGGDLGIWSSYRVREPVQLNVPPRVSDLISALAEVPRKDMPPERRGCGLPYSRIVQILYRMCKDKTIAATLSIQAADVIDESTLETTKERPESDEPPPPTNEDDAPTPGDSRPEE